MSTAKRTPAKSSKPRPAKRKKPVAPPPVCGHSAELGPDMPSLTCTRVRGHDGTHGSGKLTWSHHDAPRFHEAVRLSRVRRPPPVPDFGAQPIEALFIYGYLSEDLRAAGIRTIRELVDNLARAEQLCRGSGNDVWLLRERLHAYRLRFPLDMVPGTGTATRLAELPGLSTSAALHFAAYSVEDVLRMTRGELLRAPGPPSQVSLPPSSMALRRSYALALVTALERAGFLVRCDFPVSTPLWMLRDDPDYPADFEIRRVRDTLTLFDIAHWGRVGLEPVEGFGMPAVLRDTSWSPGTRSQLANLLFRAGLLPPVRLTEAGAARAEER